MAIGAALSVCMLAARPSRRRRPASPDDPCCGDGRSRRAAGSNPDAGARLPVRGALGPIFSRGMDRLTDRLQKAGIRADVYEFTICRLIADQAIRDFRDDGAPIVLIGHSMGGLCALTFAGS